MDMDKGEREGESPRAVEGDRWDVMTVTGESGGANHRAQPDHWQGTDHHGLGPRKSALVNIGGII
jgi:hypothetical protein